MSNKRKLKIQFRRHFKTDTEWALAAQTRTRILNVIKTNPGCSTTEIAKIINRDHSTISHHAHPLIKAGLVRTERDGRLLRHYPKHEGN